MMKHPSFNTTQRTTWALAGFMVAMLSASAANAHWNHLPVQHPIRMEHIRELGKKFIDHARQHFPSIKDEHISYPLKNTPHIIAINMTPSTTYGMLMKCHIAANALDIDKRPNYEVVLSISGADFRDKDFHTTFQQLAIDLESDIERERAFKQDVPPLPGVITQYRLFSNWGGDLSADLYDTPDTEKGQSSGQ